MTELDEALADPETIVLDPVPLAREVDRLRAEVELLRELLDLRDLPVYERVRAYLDRYPEARKAPQEPMAKLLGMRRETYSRTRAELLRRGLG